MIERLAKNQYTTKRSIHPVGSSFERLCRRRYGDRPVTIAMKVRETDEEIDVLACYSRWKKRWMSHEKHGGAFRNLPLGDVLGVVTWS